MMIPCNYEINVAKIDTTYYGETRYIHYCRIELGDIGEKKSIEKFKELSNLFPSPDFKLTLYHVNCTSQEVL